MYEIFEALRLNLVADLDAYLLANYPGTPLVGGRIFPESPDTTSRQSAQMPLITFKTIDLDENFTKKYSYDGTGIIEITNDFGANRKILWDIQRAIFSVCSAYRMQELANLNNLDIHIGYFRIRSAGDNIVDSTSNTVVLRTTWVSKFARKFPDDN